MAEFDALDAALALFKDPVSACALQRRELPAGVFVVLAIAVGEEPTLVAAEQRTGLPRSTLQEAACFFIQQAQFDYHADSYRVLGGSRSSTHDELRRNMALLMRWLHPDLQASRARAIADREVFSARVTRAWEDLKSDERRASYDRQHPAAAVPDDGAKRSPFRKAGRTDAARSKPPESTAKTRPGGENTAGARMAGARTTGARSAGVRTAGERSAGQSTSKKPAAKDAGKGRRPASAVQIVPRVRRRFLPLSVRKIEGGSFWLRLWSLFWRTQ